MSEVTKRSDNSSSQMRLLGVTPPLIYKSHAVITSIKPYMQHVCEQRLPWSLKEVLENYL